MSGRKISSLVSNGGDVERLATGFQFTEGPVWDASEGCLLFSDIPANRIYSARVYRLNPDGREPTLLVDDMERPNGLAFSPDERTLLRARSYMALILDGV